MDVDVFELQVSGGSSLAKLVSEEKTLGCFLSPKNELKQAVLLTNIGILTFGWDADSTGCYCALTCLSHDITNQKRVG